MSLTVRIADDQDVRVTEELIEFRPPDRVSFAVEGTLTVTGELLGSFEGTALRPIVAVIADDESGATEVDLEEASLRLETVDVGIETPDAGELSPGVETFESSDDGAGSTDTQPGAVAFTVEGAIEGVPDETVESITDRSPSFESITFAVEEAVRSDGGADDVLLDLSLFGYGIVVRRNGVIEIGTTGG